MTNINNIVEIKLKRRTVEINLEEVKSLVGRNDVTINEICKVFDKTTYEKKVLHDKKIDSDTKKSFLKTLEQFVEKYTTYKNPENKRQLLYSIEKLHNENGTPLDRKEDKGGAPLDDYSVHLEALILLSLKYNLLPEKDLTGGQWAQHFRLISEGHYKSYTDFKYKENYSSIVKYARKITSDKINILDENGDSIERSLTSAEISHKVGEVLKSADTTIDRMRTTLARLHKNKLIEYHDGYTYGILVSEPKKELTDEERHYKKLYEEIKSTLSKEELAKLEESERQKAYDARKVLLDPKQKSNLTALKLEVKKDVEVLKAEGKKVSNYATLKMRSERLRNDGLENEEGVVQKFEFTFNTASINKYFTDRELEKYLNLKKNEQLKEIYENGIHEVVEKYNDLKLEHLTNWFEKQYLNRVEEIKKYKVEGKFIGNNSEETFKEKLEIKKLQELTLHSEYKRYGIDLAGALLSDKLSVAVNH